ncbi:hypothetical protein PYW07_015927 [Mythimna separata]|uniref:Uncharacterized protein n=1 Tax=Mythimna separata TaxID=271217 RepID=A0AAD7YQ78_MYTSE|nr:hypothetical protein PYW07_015927 [Mythimna separata]
MKKTDVFRTIKEGECVTSIYAQTYLPDDHCDHKRPVAETPEQDKTTSQEENDEWISPSDLLIGIVDLKPPFTSKITRGTTHQGILNIGDAILDRERAKFLKFMNGKIKENDAAWNYIMEHEKSTTAKKVKSIYHDILTKKSKILLKEMDKFFEKNLQELEDHLRSEVQTVLTSAHANIVSDLNFQIKENLKKEKITLEGVLQKKYDSEVKKINHYYKLLLDNEKNRNNKLINKAIYERNDALKAFYKQLEAENITSTMYIMSTERKKCRIRKFILESIQSTEIAEKLQKIKERQNIIDELKAREKQITDINREWEDKIKKILHLFLKFVSFSLKLLPEQATFLLDLEKMVVLQLNEMQKSPSQSNSILIDEDDQNLFSLEMPSPDESVCDKEPFVIEGDLSDPVPPTYGSRETLPLDADLPYVRLQRKFIYAKCGKMDEVRAFLESQKCQCQQRQYTPPETPSPPSPKAVVEPQEPTPSAPTPSKSTVSEQKLEEIKSDSSFEPLFIDNIKILQNCPARRCQGWASKYSFPFLLSYLDFTEEKYQNIKAIFDKLPETDAAPDLIDPMLMTTQELPFAATKEPYHTVGTQYSSQEDITLECPCTGKSKKTEVVGSEPKVKLSENQEIKNIVMKRQQSIDRILTEHPKLLKLFTDESFDFTYTMKP